MLKATQQLSSEEGIEVKSSPSPAFFSTQPMLLQVWYVTLGGPWDDFRQCMNQNENFLIVLKIDIAK